MAYNTTDFKGHTVNCVKNYEHSFFVTDIEMGANYEQYNEIVFANPLKREVEEIESIIVPYLIGGSWFIADNWAIPNRFFKIAYGMIKLTITGMSLIALKKQKNT